MKIKINVDSRKAVVLRLPRGGQTYPACAEQLFKVLSKTNTIFRKGQVIYEVINHPVEMQVLTPVNLVARTDKYCYCFTYTPGGKGRKPVQKPCRMFVEEAKILMGTDEARKYLPSIKMATTIPVLYVHQKGQLKQARVAPPGFGERHQRPRLNGSESPWQQGSSSYDL